MTKKCSCGKEIEDKYDKCYDCFKKTKPNSKDVKKRHENKEDKDNWIDLGKEITVQLWVLLGTFIAGAVIGAIIF